MNRSMTARNPRRLLTIGTALLVAVFIAAPAPSFASPTDSDIPACDADDPDFGTNCAEPDEEEDGTELRDGTLDSRQIPGDVITTGDLELAAQQAAAIEQELRGLVNPNWTFVGPSNVGGRVTDIAPDPTLPGTVLSRWRRPGSGRARTAA